MSAAILHTRFCDMVGVRYPIVQTGMGWVSGPQLTAATSTAGGLGILGTATMTFDEMRAAIRYVRERTTNPFGVNFRPDQTDLAERLAFVVSEGIKVASFAGAPSKATVAQLRDAGVLSIVTIGARRHAEKMLEYGVNALIAQGGEGGGHTGSVPTSLLLPQVTDVVGGAVPVLGAGGFFDGRGLVAALAYGAQGIAMGTRFLLTRESKVPDEIKQRYLGATVFDTVVTKAIDGAPQRVIRTPFIDRLENSSLVNKLPKAAQAANQFRRAAKIPVVQLVKEGLALKRESELGWFDVMMAANAPMLTKAAMVDGNPEAGILPTGQGVGVVEEIPSVEELISRIMAQAEQTLSRLASTDPAWT